MVQYISHVVVEPCQGLVGLSSLVDGFDFEFDLNYSKFQAKYLLLLEFFIAPMPEKRGVALQSCIDFYEFRIITDLNRMSIDFITYDTIY
jgi:hypothetical protein